MTAMMETCLIIALSFAVFSAVATVGASLALGIGFERLRAGFEVIRKQTGYFSDQIYKIDKDAADDQAHRPAFLSVDSGLIAQARTEQPLGVSFDAPSAPSQRMLLEGDSRPEGIRFH